MTANDECLRRATPPKDVILDLMRMLLLERTYLTNCSRRSAVDWPAAEGRSCEQGGRHDSADEQAGAHVACGLPRSSRTNQANGCCRPVRDAPPTRCSWPRSPAALLSDSSGRCTR